MPKSSSSIDLYADNNALIRAANTAMDQTYGKTEKGYVLQPIDNSGQGRTQPWVTPPGFVIQKSIDEPAMGGKFVIYKNANNQVMVVGMGTNGNSDRVGWLSNLEDFGLSQWRSRALNDEGRTVKQLVYEALNFALEGGGQLLIAGDSKGGALAQYMLYDIVTERNKKSLGDWGFSNLAALRNDQIGVVTNNAPGSEVALSAIDREYKTKSQQFQGVQTFYATSRMQDDSKTEIVSQTGGAYLANDGTTRQYSLGVGTDRTQVDQNANGYVYMHRLAFAGYDGLAALKGDFSKIPVVPREFASVNEMAAIGGFMAGIGQGEVVSNMEATARLGAGVVCAFVTSPASAVQGLFKGKVGLQSAAGAAALGLWASGIGPLLAAACGVSVAGANGVKYLGDGKGSVAISNEDLRAVVNLVKAPADVPTGVTRVFGHTATGGAYVFDAAADQSGGTLYCSEQGVRTTAAVRGNAVNLNHFDAVTGKATGDGFFSCGPDQNNVLTEIRYGANGRIAETKTSVTGINIKPLVNQFVFDNNISRAPSSTVLGANKFYVSPSANDLATIASVTGASLDALIAANPSLSANASLVTGTLVNLPQVDNRYAPTISVTPNPIARTEIETDTSAAQSVSNGYAERTATASVRFAGNTLESQDFTQSQKASLATGGVRPGAIQRDPNARPNTWLEQNFTPYVSGPVVFGDTPNLSLLNAAALGSLSSGSTQQIYVDPILLDLSGKGVHMSNYANNGVLFDTDHSGTLRRTGWADASTGMLVNDNGTGQITDVSQMFSDYYGGAAGKDGLSGSKPYKDGYAALAAQDSNQDRRIDNKDPIWNSLKVWVDASHDGKVQEGELKSLDALGITQFDLATTAAADGEMRDGNRVLAYGRFTINGQSREALGVDFIADPTRTTVTALANGKLVTSTAAASANPGFGVLPGGAGAAPRLPASVKTYASNSSSGEVMDAARLGVNNLYGSNGNDTMIAAASGSWLVGGGGSNVYQGGVGDDVLVISASDEQKNIRGGGGVNTAIIVGKAGVTLNMAQAQVQIAEGGAGNDVITSGGRTGVYIKGGSGNATLIGGAGDDVIVGGSGRNVIIGGSGKALIYAGPNGDTIYGASGDSIINAGGGADRIFAGAANDIIKVGKGNATIDGGGGVNIAQLHGSYGDYRISKTADGYIVADKQAGRDGTVTLRNIQKLNFSDISAVDLTTPNPMPVADRLTTGQSGKAFDRTQAHLIGAAQLLANDQALNSQGALRISAVSDAIGGSVSLTRAGDVLFTPDPAFTGIMGFKYGVSDAAGHESAIVQDLSSGKTAPMRAAVALLTAEVPGDPLVAQQWYLTDANILPVWKDYTGKGVRIGQFEPGGEFAVGPEILNYHHADLAPNVDASWLASQRAAGTLPTSFSNHATMVAGVMVAAKNGEGVVGVAYDAKITAYALANSGNDVSGLGKMSGVDIANHSWGFTNDFGLSNISEGRVDTVSALLANAQYAAGNGRGGLGTVIVTAGGNSRAAGGNAQGSLTNNNRFSVQVGAINAAGDLSTLSVGQAAFSSPGASILVSAPGSNVVSTSQMITTDQGSIFGSNISAMQGTSFATPIVSGVVALMLQANPNLGYRDVQKILALSARRINDASTTWTDNGARDWNGGAMHTSNDYGFGEVDARAAVRLAETWMSKSTAENEFFYSAVSPNIAKNANAGETIASTLSMNSGLRVEHVEIDLNTTFARLGDLVVKLISPNGTQSILLNRQGKVPEGMPGANANDRGSAQSGTLKYTFMTTHDLGEQSGGNWTLQVTDAANGQPVTLNNWGLRLYGSRTGSDDTYVYTDEYRLALMTNASRGVLDDATNGSAGGKNTINAAAVSADTSINLVTGQASLGGAALTIRNPGAIQNIVTGDGNDTLVANDNAAILDGGRGKNTLTGGRGKDLFVIRRRDDGLDTLVNFEPARGHAINLVGFRGMGFKDLTLTQQANDVKLALGGGQSVLIKNQTLAKMASQQLFSFQDSFSAPSAYVDSGSSSMAIPGGTSVISLVGGGMGVSLTSSPSGQMLWSLAGTVYSHDNATSDRFVIAPQAGKTDYRNALRGFKHGIDKIDLSQLGITRFSDLTIAKTNRGTINNVSTISGVTVSSTSLGVNGRAASLVYLDTLDLSQVTESDFIFAQPGPTKIGAISIPSPEQPAPVVPSTPVPPVVVAPIVVPQPPGPSPVVVPVAPRPSPVVVPVAPVQPPLIPSFGAASLTARSPSYRMIDNTQRWNSDVLSSMFTIPQGDNVSYAATLINGAALPSWLSYDAIQNKLIGTPGAGTSGVTGVKVTATNQRGVSASSLLELQIHANVLNVDVFQTVAVSDTQVAINEANAFSTITATGGSHVLLQSGSGAAATLQGSGANKVTITGSGNTLTLGSGTNDVKLAGMSARVSAGNGANTISSTDSSAELTLGDGNNSVSGSFRTLTVGKGNNTINSSGAIATLNLGDGRDIATISGAISTVNVGHGVYDLDFTGALGKLAFSADIASDRLWFKHVGQDLNIAVLGSTEAVTLKDWYAGTPHQTSDIVAGDGKSLSSYSVESLVQAMAAFNPPSAGVASFTPAQQQALRPVIAANWR
ncbi:S8 family serine peptidase [Herbaspirillum seropedicae]|uniref:S8 family serine peptidase n=1 Tax=Herbaspirillum seropedicae TaxID=964 RepID=UPI001C610BD6|nr:S8 family serine peptidase [Herbaspirillum seropedicae]